MRLDGNVTDLARWNWISLGFGFGGKVARVEERPGSFVRSGEAPSGLELASTHSCQAQKAMNLPCQHDQLVPEKVKGNFKFAMCSPVVIGCLKCASLESHFPHGWESAHSGKQFPSVQGPLCLCHPAIYCGSTELNSTCHQRNPGNHDSFATDVGHGSGSRRRASSSPPHSLHRAAPWPP